MNFTTNKETERKYLIEYPSASLLESIPSEKASEIEQTYLISERGVTSRVRKRVTLGKAAYTKTEKTRINDVSCIEKEAELSEEEYLSELKKADPARRVIKKKRLLLERNGYVFEIDLYPFWDERAILEIEFSDEDGAPELPKDVTVIKEVTGDKRYKNASLAKSIPNDEI